MHRRWRASAVAAGVGAVLAIGLGGPAGATTRSTTSLTRAASATAPSADATNFQEDAAHDGTAPGTPLNPSTLHLLWKRGFTGTPSYPIIAGGIVYVAFNPHGGGIWYLEALDLHTGAVLWRSKPVVDATPAYGSLAYEDGRLFFVDVDRDVRAYDGATGALLWDQPRGPYSCATVTGVPTTYGGNLIIPEGCYGTIDGFNEVTGAGASTGPPAIPGNQASGPAISTAGIFTTEGCPEVFGYSNVTRSQWIYNQTCSGGGGTTTVVHGNQVWARNNGYGAGVVLNATTGALLGHFLSDAEPPAFDGTTAITVDADAPPPYQSTLMAYNATTLATEWTQAADGALDTPAVVSGHVAYVGSWLGNLYGISTATGAVVWKAKTPARIIGGDLDVQPLGLNIGDGVLAVPSAQTLFVYGS